METLRAAAKVVALLGAGALVGSSLFVLVTPGDVQKKAMLQEMPQHDPRSRDEATRNQHLVMAVLKEAAATQENVAWRKNWMVGGGRSA